MLERCDCSDGKSSRWGENSGCEEKFGGRGASASEYASRM